MVSREYNLGEPKDLNRKKGYIAKTFPLPITYKRRLFREEDRI